MDTCSLGFSPCPNDTFMFYALVHGLTDSRIKFDERLEDVETLNRLVLEGSLDVSKVSCHLLGHVREDYCFLRAGAALGRGCGPLLVSRQQQEISSLRGKRIAVPGKFTTAVLLLRLADPLLDNLVILPFNEIMGAVARGDVEAGLIIHESRFTYPQFGLVRLLDLGEWWESESGKPIPLGGIVARRSLGDTMVAAIERALRQSVEFALAHPGSPRTYIRRHSQEMDENVCAAHIDLYVNHFSVDIGREGESAIETLLGRAEAEGIVPRSGKNAFLT